MRRQQYCARDETHHLQGPVLALTQKRKTRQLPSDPTHLSNVAAPQNSAFAQTANTFVIPVTGALAQFDVADTSLRNLAEFRERFAWHVRCGW